jgi:hypothetical protein
MVAETADYAFLFRNLRVRRTEIAIPLMDR